MMKPYKQTITFICLTGLLFWTILPGLNALFNTSPNKIWLEICTPYGLERLALNTSPEAKDPEEDTAPQPQIKNHCPLCSIRLAMLLPEQPLWTKPSIAKTSPVIWPTQKSKISDPVKTGPVTLRAPPVFS